MCQIFCSYGHKDAIFVKAIVEALKDKGYTVWFDKQFDDNGIVIGDNYDIAITEAIKEAIDYPPRGKGRMIYFLSNDSIRKHSFCLNEIAYAYDHNLRILPIKLQDVEQPIIIYRYQHLDFREIYNNVKPDVQGEQFQESVQSLIDAIEHEEIAYNDESLLLIKLLKPLEYRGEICLYRALDANSFYGRQWFFDDFNQWLADEHNPQQVFLLVGMPGIGKSWISSRLIQTCTNVVAFHFFRRDSLSRRIKEAIRSVAYQLSKRYNEYRRRILKLQEYLLNSGTDTDLFNLLIYYPLSECPPQKEPAVILFDAVDEAETMENGVSFANFLAEYIYKLPTWVRFFITSRPKQGYLETNTFKNYEINPELESHQNDIIGFLNSRGLDGALANTICERTQGSFLYARFVINDRDNGIENFAAVPNELGSYYNNRFDSWFGRRINEYRNRIRPILEILSAQVEPFTINRLKSCLDFYGNYDNPNDGISDFINDMKGFFVVDVNECIRPFHSSLFSWISNEKSRYEIDINKGYCTIGKWLNRVFENTGYNLFCEGDDGVLLLNWFPDILRKINAINKISIDTAAVVSNYLNRVKDMKILDLVEDKERFQYIQAVLSYAFKQNNVEKEVIQQAYDNIVKKDIGKAQTNNLNIHKTGLSYLYSKVNDPQFNDEQLVIPVQEDNSEYGSFLRCQLPRIYIPSSLGALGIYKVLMYGIITAFQEEGNQARINGILDVVRSHALGPYNEIGKDIAKLLDETANHIDSLEGADTERCAAQLRQNAILIRTKLQ